MTNINMGYAKGTCREGGGGRGRRERERFMLYGGALKAHLEAISVITITNV